MLEAILAKVGEVTGLPVRPFWTDEAGDCVLYRWYCLRDDGRTARCRLELRLITGEAETALAKEGPIRRALVDLGDDGKFPGASIVQSGGEALRSAETGAIHTLFDFDVKVRSDWNG